MYGKAQYRLGLDSRRSATRIEDSVLALGTLQDQQVTLAWARTEFVLMNAARNLSALHGRDYFRLERGK